MQWRYPLHQAVFIDCIDEGAANQGRDNFDKTRAVYGNILEQQSVPDKDTNSRNINNKKKKKKKKKFNFYLLVCV